MAFSLRSGGGNIREKPGSTGDSGQVKMVSLAMEQVFSLDRVPVTGHL